MRIRADEKNLPLNLEYKNDIPETIKTDRTRLRQILINVIGNAIKFTESGYIKLSVELIDRDNSPRLQFEVIDTGLGMTKQQVSHLFQPFTQADTSTTRRFGGTGLGLTISKRLARILGGDIRVVETNPGTGTTFRVTISTGSLSGVGTVENPIIETFYTPKDPLAANEKDINNLAGIKILLAEDNPTIQMVISRIVEKAGATTVVVENGQLAFEAAINAKNVNTPFDLILMDMQMPVADGYQATKMLRKADFKRANHSSDRPRHGRRPAKMHRSGMR